MTLGYHKCSNQSTVASSSDGRRSYTRSESTGHRKWGLHLSRRTHGSRHPCSRTFLRPNGGIQTLLVGSVGCNPGGAPHGTGLRKLGR